MRENLGTRQKLSGSVFGGLSALLIALALATQPAAAQQTQGSKPPAAKPAPAAKAAPAKPSAQTPPPPPAPTVNAKGWPVIETHWHARAADRCQYRHDPDG